MIKFILHLLEDGVQWLSIELLQWILERLKHKKSTIENEIYNSSLEQSRDISEVDMAIAKVETAIKEKSI